MTEQEYIHATILGKIDAIIGSVKTLTTELLPDIIKEKEKSIAIGTLYNWRERIADRIKTEENEK